MEDDDEREVEAGQADAGDGDDDDDEEKVEFDAENPNANGETGDDDKPKQPRTSFNIGNVSNPNQPGRQHPYFFEGGICLCEFSPRFPTETEDYAWREDATVK